MDYLHVLLGNMKKFEYRVVINWIFLYEIGFIEKVLVHVRNVSLFLFYQQKETMERLKTN